jgi:CHAT domain-containing protein
LQNRLDRPDWLLALLPLHAIAWEESDGSCLIDEFDVAFVPSAYAWDVCRTRAEANDGLDNLLAVGNPLPARIPLPHAELEASLISQLLPAKRATCLVAQHATKDAVVEQMPLASHIHVACHGHAAGDPESFDTALLLANDAALSARELLEMDLSRARLVVASACETGMLAGYHALDESLALSTVLIGAGAAGVVASQWSVNDYATLLLMTRFYEMLEAMPGRPVTALCAAQRWLRDLTGEREATFLEEHRNLRAFGLRHGADPVRSRHDRVSASRAASDRPFRSPRHWGAFAISGL